MQKNQVMVKPKDTNDIIFLQKKHQFWKVLSKIYLNFNETG